MMCCAPRPSKRSMPTVGMPLLPSGQASEFFKGSFPGLTTALGVLKRGFVLVGGVSTTDGGPVITRGTESLRTLRCQIGSGFEASVGLGPIDNRHGGITRAVVGLGKPIELFSAA